MEAGELPLVPKQFHCWLCSFELMSLLLRGNAMGNVGTYTQNLSVNPHWDGKAQIGVLSKKEKEMGIPVAKALKTPDCPIWILHSTDHFTIAWANAMPGLAPGTPTEA